MCIGEGVSLSLYMVHCVRPNVHAICGHLWYAPITQFIVDWHDLYAI